MAMTRVYSIAVALILTGASASRSEPNSQTAESTPNAVGHVVNVVGEAWINSPSTSMSSEPRQAIRGLALLPGDVVRTMADGRLRLLMKDKSLLEIGSGTTLTLQSYVVDTSKKQRKARLKLTVGRFWARVSKALSSSESADFSVETANAVAGVRGTELYVDQPTEESAADVTVVVGVVDVEPIDAAGNLGPATRLEAMERASIEPGGAVTKTSVTPRQMRALAASTRSSYRGTSDAQGGGEAGPAEGSADSVGSDGELDMTEDGGMGAGAELPNLDPGSGSSRIRINIDVRD